MQILQLRPKHDFLHMKRESNQSADRLAISALQQETGTIVTSHLEMQQLISLNQSGELIVLGNADRVVMLAATTRSTLRRRRRPEVLYDEVLHQIRVGWIKQTQEEEV